MGRRGPAPTPSALKLLSGSRRINRREPQPHGEPVAPSWLSPGARKIWDAQAPTLAAAGLLASWDIQLFATWCDASSLHHEAAEHLAEQGAVLTFPARNRNTGQVVGTRSVPNPWVGVWRSSADLTARLASRFGLSPTDRAVMPTHKQGATQ